MPPLVHESKFESFNSSERLGLNWAFLFWMVIHQRFPTVRLTRILMRMFILLREKCVLQQVNRFVIHSTTTRRIITVQIISKALVVILTQLLPHGVFAILCDPYSRKRKVRMTDRQMEF
jgi:hypothetical protein